MLVYFSCERSGSGQVKIARLSDLKQIHREVCITTLIHTPNLTAPQVPNNYSIGTIWQYIKLT